MRIISFVLQTFAVPEFCNAAFSTGYKTVDLISYERTDLNGEMSAFVIETATLRP
jgi:hypothetical protein